MGTMFVQLHVYGDFYRCSRARNFVVGGGVWRELILAFMVILKVVTGKWK